MTLIIGICCADGLVVAADGAATLGSMGNMTAQQKTVKKLSILQGKIVVGVAGAVGLGQRLIATLDEGYKANKFKGRPELAMTPMRNAFWEVVKPEMEAAATTARTMGAQIALSSANTSMIVALPIESKPVLLQFDHQCAPEMATDALPFVAIGSGQPQADPFLAFIRRIFWPTKPPSLQDGVFSAVWALRHTIETIPGGVADPIQVAVLEKVGKDLRARELDDAELDGHVAAIKSAERSLGNWRSQFTAAPAGSAPEQPPA